MILLLSDDLLDASKTIANGRAAGVAVLQCKSLPALVEQMEMNEIACCIIDLQCPGLMFDELMFAVGRRPKPTRLIAYGSHVDAARLKAARDAGCDQVMPRSKYFEEMPSHIAEWAAANP
jgi:DNA-binding NarL/FixJ family response regulator